MQLAIAVIGLVAAVIPLIGSIWQIAPASGRAQPQRRRRAGWLFATAVLIAALGFLAAYVIVPRFGPERPLAEIVSPRDSEKIERPQTVDVRLNEAIPDDRTVWLGYQNERGGPFIVQAAECVAIEQRLDCGPVFVGENDKDRAEFRLFVATADAAATAHLKAAAADVGPQYGMNMSCPRLPAGAQIINETRRVVLG